MRYLHTMIRVSDPDASIRFFELLGLKEVRRTESQAGRFTLIFMATDEDATNLGARRQAEVELTYNWPPEDGSAPEAYAGGRNFGHLAYRVENVYETCQRLMDAGVTINRPPRDGNMAFVRTPDAISIELLQDGDPAAARRALVVDAQHRQLVMAAPLEVVRVDALSDNYVWLVHDPESGETVVIDPGEAAPVEAALAARGWRPGAIWNTHWHPDHTGGNAALKAAHGVPVFAPAAEAARIPTADQLLREGDTVRIGAHAASVLETPAHTAGHISFHFADDALLFPGDTLFAMGCGRLFEGTAAQMHAAMARFAALPEATLVFAAHEYTLGNARFAAHAEPDNAAIAQRLAEVTATRDAGQATLPTTIALERDTNPFMRADTVQRLAELRAAKDAF